MKIAICTTMQHPCHPDLGWGAESYIQDLVECLNMLGQEVILFAKEGSSTPLDGKLVICKSEEEVLNYQLTLETCDIIHDFSTMKGIHDYCYQIRQGTLKSISTNFNTHFLYPKIQKNICTVSDRQKYLGLQGRSGFERTPWQQMVGYTGQLRNAKTIYLGLNTEKYIPTYEKQDFILYFNSFDYRKGITTAIQLANEMGFSLIIAGETKGHPEHQETFKQLKPIMDASPNIKYFTDVTNEQKIELMQKAKAFLFPSMFEQPFAFVVAQALACGTPVITTNYGAMPEQVINGETGILCDTYEQFNKAITLIDNINPIDCRKDVIKRFDRMITAKNYLKLYQDVFNGEEW